MKTSIQIYNKDWKRVNNRKEPKESFADTIERMLDQLETLEKEFNLNM